MLLLIIVFISSFCFGRYNVNLHELLRILANRVIPLEHTWTAEMETVVINIRLPRIVLACLVGCCLSVAGASYQGVFQNPMASPDFLGATSGAAFGAALAILLGSSSRMITILAFFFSLVSVFLVYFIGRYAPGKGVINMILAGIMISSLFTAGTSFIKLVADPNNQLPAITYWLMGSLSGAKNNEVVFALIPMAIGMIPLFVMRWRINILTLSDEESNAIGINANMLRLIVIISSTLITAASVSVSGTIGWVGLVIPHLCRRMIGNNYTYLLP
ncbi:MAG: iron ABC transporter permease, partial [Clostridiaceae bacterium]|nr:iron ABC transporter permease [Clostridiaceae bacterium]